MQPIDVMLEAKKHNLKVEFVNYGIASRIGDTILMNINMPQYDDYCKKVLDHEIRHTADITKKNFMMDMFEGSIVDNLLFCSKHPKAFSQFIPFGRYKGNWFIDINQIIVYFVGLLIIGMWYLLII